MRKSKEWNYAVYSDTSWIGIDVPGHGYVGWRPTERGEPIFFARDCVSPHHTRVSALLLKLRGYTEQQLARLRAEIPRAP